MGTRTKFVILMHPYEFKRIKANTGRLTHLCLADSELHVGESFDDHAAVQARARAQLDQHRLGALALDAVDQRAAGPVPAIALQHERPRAIAAAGGRVAEAHLRRRARADEAHQNVASGWVWV